MRSLRPRETEPRREGSWPALTAQPFIGSLTDIQWPLGKGVWELGHGRDLSSPVGETGVHSADQSQMVHYSLNCARLAESAAFTSTNGCRGFSLCCQSQAPQLMSQIVRANVDYRAALLNFSPVQLFGIRYHVYLAGNSMWYFTSPRSG